jgi:uncharacterized protein (DUF488 family)
MRIFTVGHSTRPIETLVGLLENAGVSQLVDVRSIPRSRRHPQFNRESLAMSLKDAGVDYRHAPGLGGRRQPDPQSINLGLDGGFQGFADYMTTAEFERELRDLIELAQDQPTAIMCAERLPEQCHRSLISDALSARGVDVRHLVTEAEQRPHVMTPSAVVQEMRLTYPFALRPGGRAKLR